MGIPLNALIVEDSEDDAELMLRELRLAGFDPYSRRVDSAAGLDTALFEHPWDVILCDYVMPGFDALRAIEVLEQASRDIPLIVVSGKIGEETAVDAMRAGACDYVLKSNLTRLGAAVERELSDSLTRREQARRAAEARLVASYCNSIADLAIGVMEGESPGVTIDRATRLAADALQSPLSKVESGQRVVASVGWNAGAWEGRGAQQEAAAILRAGGPVHISSAVNMEVLGSDREFSDHGVRAGVVVPVTSRGEVLGTLGVYSPTNRRFRSDDVMMLQRLAAIIGAALKVMSTQPR